MVLVSVNVREKEKEREKEKRKQYNNVHLVTRPHPSSTFWWRI